VNRPNAKPRLRLREVAPVEVSACRKEAALLRWLVGPGLGLAPRRPVGPGWAEGVRAAGGGWFAVALEMVGLPVHPMKSFPVGLDKNGEGSAIIFRREGCPHE